MRISDWSSDVCSSDLARPSTLDRARLALCGLCARIAGNHDCRPLHRAPCDRTDRGAVAGDGERADAGFRSEEHTSELQSLMRNSYAVFCLKKKKKNIQSKMHLKNNK